MKTVGNGIVEGNPVPKNCSTCSHWKMITTENLNEWGLLGNWALTEWGWCRRPEAIEQYMYTLYLESPSLTQSQVYCPGWALIGHREEPQ